MKVSVTKSVRSFKNSLTYQMNSTCIISSFHFFDENIFMRIEECLSTFTNNDIISQKIFRIIYSQPKINVPTAVLRSIPLIITYIGCPTYCSRLFLT